MVSACSVEPYSPAEYGCRPVCSNAIETDSHQLALIQSHPRLRGHLRVRDGINLPEPWLPAAWRSPPQGSAAFNYPYLM